VDLSAIAESRHANPNDITVTHEFGSVEAAQAFANTDELKKAIQGAGVVGAPTIWFTNKV
jgi:hypothetical protein